MKDSTSINDNHISLSSEELENAVTLFLLLLEWEQDLVNIK